MSSEVRPTASALSPDVPTAPPFPISAPPPPVIEPYELGALLGEGGMGRVYGAVHKMTRRPCALKLLSPALTRQPDFVSRFQLEAQTLARLNHPNVVQIYTGGHADGHYFLEMEFVDGGDLQKRVLGQLEASGAGLPEADVLRVTDATLAALEYAHSKGVVHRDLKPANILLSTAGDVKVSDFGLASVIGEDLHRSRIEATLARPSLHQVTSMETVTYDPAAVSGSFGGTILYMSPQALRSEPPDPRDDLFSLGVAVYFMLVGRTPAVSYTPVSRQRRDLTRDWDAFIASCLAEDRNARYANATAARQALAQGLQLRRRTRWWIPASLVVVLAAVAAGTVWLTRGGLAPTTAASSETTDTERTGEGSGEITSGPAGASETVAPGSIADGGGGPPAEPLEIATSPGGPAAPSPSSLDGSTPASEPAIDAARVVVAPDLVDERSSRRAVLEPLTLSLPGGVSIDFLPIPPGRAALGSPRSEMGRSPDEAQHWFVEPRGFLIGRTEVTQAQYEALTGQRPSHHRAGGADRPVEQIRYTDVAGYTAAARGTFLGELNAALHAAGHTAWEAGLPTEAEWEYACRAGVNEPFHNGAELHLPIAHGRIERVAIYGREQTAPVASREPNAWGLYDMHGNVAEWTEEGVLRGGSFRDAPAGIRASSRIPAADAQRTTDRRYGFRVILRAVGSNE